MVDDTASRMASEAWILVDFTMCLKLLAGAIGREGPSGCLE